MRIPVARNTISPVRAKLIETVDGRHDVAFGVRSQASWERLEQAGNVGGEDQPSWRPDAPPHSAMSPK